jgi:hypothetical protein
MATPRYERCPVWDVRCVMAKVLGLPTDEDPDHFWSRVEKAGRLVEALACYDRLVVDLAARAKVVRESKQQFLLRVEQEGRLAEVERKRSDLIAGGMSQRDAQASLVESFQPLDGKKTKGWRTPDPWYYGRLFHKKKDQDRLVRLANRENDEDEYVDDYDDEEYEEQEVHDARDRVAWAQRRRAERIALADARQRARDLPIRSIEHPLIHA